jgi:endonuclease/exonuclease/phosphatase family metal-dependent hydrolase
MIRIRDRSLILLAGLLTAAIQAQELSFVTINIWSGLDYKGTLKMGEYESKEIRQGRFRLLVEELKELDPDVIAVNEANPLPRYARRLAKDLNYDYIYSVGMGGIKFGGVGIPVNFREGDAILARKGLGLTEVGAPRLSPGAGVIGNFFCFHFGESNQAIAGRITIEGKTIYVVNTHLHAGLQDDERWLVEMGLIRDSGAIDEDGYNEIFMTWRESINRRQEETQVLLQWMGRAIPQDAQVVLLGDFNAVPTSEEINWVRAEGFEDTWQRNQGDEEPGYTWDSMTNLNIQTYYEVPEPDAPGPWYDKLSAENEQVPKRIDYIFVKNVPGRDIRSTEVVLNRAPRGQHPSDHHGVMARIYFDNVNPIDLE